MYFKVRLKYGYFKRNLLKYFIVLLGWRFGQQLFDIGILV